MENESDSSQMILLLQSNLSASEVKYPSEVKLMTSNPIIAIIYLLKDDH